MPGRVLGENAAEDEADGRTTPGERAVDTEGLGPLLGVREGDGDEAQCCGGEQRGEQALKAAGGKELPGARGNAAEE